jgi:uncharacterized protein (UPF0333 family)
MSNVVLIIGIVVLLFVIFAVFGDHAAKSVGKKAKKLMISLDLKYEDFVEKRITLNILKNESFDIDIEKITEEALMILKPDIDGVISQINANSMSTAEIDYDSKYFKNAVSLINSLYRKKFTYSNKMLARGDEIEFNYCFRDGIKADLAKRKLDLETNNYSSR